MLILLSISHTDERGIMSLSRRASAQELHSNLYANGNTSLSQSQTAHFEPVAGESFSKREIDQEISVRLSYIKARECSVWTQRDKGRITVK
jgi:hypothetical protein